MIAIRVSETRRHWSTTARHTCKCDPSHAPPVPNHLEARRSWTTTWESTRAKSLSFAICVAAALWPKVNWNLTKWTGTSESNIRSAIYVQTVGRALWKSLIFEVSLLISRKYTQVWHVLHKHPPKHDLQCTCASILERDHFPAPSAERPFVLRGIWSTIVEYTREINHTGVYWITTKTINWSNSIFLRCETCAKCFASCAGLRQHFKCHATCRMQATEGAYCRHDKK